MALTELKGKQMGTQRVTIERGPVRTFARAIKDESEIFDGEAAPVPATFPFVMAYWGSQGVGGASTLPIEQLRGPGRMILHGEQEFVYHGWPQVGQTLEGNTFVADVYEKERSSGGKMEFYVTETEWKDAGSGDPVVTTRFTLIVNVRPSS
jgi:hypothetical protein